MECPYCRKKRSQLNPGKYQCTRCTGKFEIRNDFKVKKIFRSKIYTIASIGSFVLTGIVFFILNKTIQNQYELERWENVACSVGVTGFIISEILGGIHMGIFHGRGAILYREDNPRIFKFFLIVFALIGIAALITGILEAFDIIHLRK